MDSVCLGTVSGKFIPHLERLGGSPKVLGIPHHSIEPGQIMGTLSCVWIYLRGASPDTQDEVDLVRFSEMLIIFLFILSE